MVALSGANWCSCRALNPTATAPGPIIALVLGFMLFLDGLPAKHCLSLECSVSILL